LAELPDPHAGPGQVRIRVRAAGLCGTDVLIARGSMSVPVPVVLGHELAGTVDEVGAGVTDIRLGERVTTETDAFVCGQCAFCRAGDTHLCPRRRAVGTTADGGFADHVVVPARGVHAIPAHVDFAAGALTEPLAVAVHAVAERGHIKPGERVVVIGPGTVGLLAAQVGRALGARVTLAGLARHKARFRLGRELGIDSAVVLGRAGDLAADVAIECSGAPRALADGLRLVRKGGRVVLVGFYGKPVRVDADRVINSELSLIASRGKRPESFRLALGLMCDKRVDTARLVTHMFPLEQWDAALAVAERSGTKVVFDLTSA
jgi:L-iditol 2-dehydrogenase